ncbi:PH domain-containing protein, partial [Kineococcus glutinatus]|uniref:PH domain-containing protein n=1 Tax=Kineococcus glutinatus TaxID=1070872 RepID=UPI0031F0ED68
MSAAVDGAVGGAGGGGLSRAEAIAQLGEPFRPRRARAVGYPLAAALFVVFAVVGVAVLLTDYPGWTVLDTVLCTGFGALLAAVLLRLVGIRALPGPDALVVRNVVFTTSVPWASIVAVRFGGADPWLLLDLDDGQALAVMAV